MNNGTYQQPQPGRFDEDSQPRRDGMGNGLPRRERTIGGYGGGYGAGHGHPQSESGNQDIEHAGENAQRRPTRPNREWSSHNRSRDSFRRNGDMQSGTGDGSRQLEG